VVTSLNRAGALERCLQAVLEHTSHTPMKVIVVDNGSTDGSVEMVRRRFPSIELIEKPETREPGGRAIKGWPPRRVSYLR
jgi:GT2 family glycosyltransferase